MLRIPPQARKDSPLLINVGLCLILILVGCLTAAAQTTSDSAAQRKQALDLYDRNKFTDAIPILEKLVSENPDDQVMLERLGWATFVVSGSIKEPEVRKQAREKALSYLKRAKALGDDSELLRTGLDALSQPDTTDTRLSSVPAADAALREGEEAHSRGDLDAAIKGYKRALELDPRNYLAALFTGDMYFKKAYLATNESVKRQMTVAAGEWFAKAITIDPNIETAHRYWGDALMAVGDQDSAKEKFIEGIVAEPFNRSPYAGLSQWADKFKVSMAHPLIEQPKSTMSASANGTETTITVDAKAREKGTPEYYWSFYDLTRTAYKVAGFKKEHASEKEYRHSLSEEASALRAVAEIAAKDQADGQLKRSDPSLENLIRLFKADLIEAYILFVRLDEGIARDYVDYRKVNREKLHRYWNDFVIAKQRGF
jgi:tetratricopeptide (TPR) repeat protein